MNTRPELLNLKVLVPSRVFAEEMEVTRIVAETPYGSFGILPHRLDCIAAIQPGILTYENADKGEVYVAVDEGVLVKTGFNVLVSVRNAISGTDLGQLEEAVNREFRTVSEKEKSFRAIVGKIESHFLRNLHEFYREG